MDAVAPFILVRSRVQLGRERGLFGTSVDGKTQFVAVAVAVMTETRYLPGAQGEP